MAFTYTNKPDPGDILAVSQADLKNNFQYLQASLNKDHQIVFGDNNTTLFEGRHRAVSLLDRAVTPAFPGDGTDMYLYSNTAQLFVENASKNYRLTPSLGVLAAGRYLIAAGVATASGNVINITDVTKSGVRWNVNFTSNSPTDDFIPLLTLMSGTATPMTFVETGRSVGGWEFQPFVSNTGISTDPTEISISIFYPAP